MQNMINTTLHPLFIAISEGLGKAVEIIWYYPVVMLCLFCGIFFTLRFWFIQFRGFKHAIHLLKGRYDNPDEPGHITHFQALMAALSGTIGLGTHWRTGRYFWMWIVGILTWPPNLSSAHWHQILNQQTRRIWGLHVLH